MAVKTAATLAYLKNLPNLSSNKVLSGQWIGGLHYICGRNATNVRGCEDDLIYQATGLYAAIIGVDYFPSYGGNGTDFTKLNAHLINHSNNGGLVAMYLNFPNPATGNFWANGVPDSSPDLTSFTYTDLYSNLPNSINTAFKASLDQLALGLTDLQNHNVVVLFRIFHEMTWSGIGFWAQGTTTQFKQLWIYTYNYMKTTKGLQNLLFVYAPNCGWGDAYYPGDAYVDIVGCDAYGAADASGAFGQYTNQQAAYPTKPFMLSEYGICGPSNTSNNPKDPGYCTPSDLRPLMTGIKNNMPNTAGWINFGWVWSMDYNLNAQQLLQDPWTITRDEVSFSVAGGPE